MSLLTYEQVVNGNVDKRQDYGSFSSPTKLAVENRPTDMSETLAEYGLKPYITGFNLGGFMGKKQGTHDIRQELLFRMLADQQQGPIVGDENPYDGGPVGLPANNSPLPADANGNPSWLAGPQTQQLPEQSPFGQAWGGGEGTTFNPINFNQQAGLLSQNHSGPNGWLNGLLFDGPWQGLAGG